MYLQIDRFAKAGWFVKLFRGVGLMGLLHRTQAVVESVRLFRIYVLIIVTSSRASGG